MGSVTNFSRKQRGSGESTTGNSCVLHNTWYKSLISLDLLAVTVSWAGIAKPEFLHRLWPAAVLVLAFTILARLLRAVDISGALGGALLSFVLYITAGPGAFAGVVTVFVLAWIATRIGYSRKQLLGTAEKRSGRTVSQIVANLAVAALCGAASSLSNWDSSLLLATVAALAEAAADTVSSELGQASTEHPYLITTWDPVPAGTDGGVSLAGTLAGTFAAFLVALVCAVTGVITYRGILFATFAAVLGMFADSYLGAWLERRNRIGNDTVNFLSTLTAAVLAILFMRFVK